MTSVPVFCCPKCGAVADINYVPASTQADVDEWIAALVRANHDYHNEEDPTMRRLYQSKRISRVSERLDDARHRLGGPWLDCRCPRCGYQWRDVPLDNRPAGTPIYDALVSA